MTGWDKAKVEKLIGIALSFLIALLSVIGYDVVIVRPQASAALTMAGELQKQLDTLGAEVQALQPGQLEPLIEAPAGVK
jgi:hypothetical protein